MTCTVGFDSEITLSSAHHYTRLGCQKLALEAAGSLVCFGLVLLMLIVSLHLAALTLSTQATCVRRTEQHSPCRPIKNGQQCWI